MGGQYLHKWQDSLVWPEPIFCFRYCVTLHTGLCNIVEGEDKVWPRTTNQKSELEVENEVIVVIQWDTYSVDSLRNKKSILITGVSAYQGEVYIIPIR